MILRLALLAPVVMLTLAACGARAVEPDGASFPDVTNRDGDDRIVIDVPVDSPPDGSMCTGATPDNCNGTCTNVQSDDNNCGSCGVRCPAGLFCNAGMCTGTCSPPRLMCGSSCVDPQTNRFNCGGCGNTCGDETECIGGRCTSPCMGGQMLCGSECTDTNVDPSNCGGCGRACPPSFGCSGGMCTPLCPPGTMSCGMTCADTQNDNANCGACFRACPIGTTCTGGMCVPGCLPPRTMCGAACVDTSSDPAHCGNCSTTCAPGAMCVGGMCGTTCPPPRSVCMSAGGPVCVDTQTDASNCGSCGNACTAGNVCVSGICRPSNDECSGATALTLDASGSATVTGSTTLATHSANACASGSNDVYFSFTLAQRSIVYADTYGSTYDTRMGFHDTCATAPTSCDDDSCGMLQSLAVGVFDPGTHFVEVGGFVASSVGTYTLHLQVLAAGSGAVSQITPGSTMASASGMTAGAGSIGGSCGASDRSGEDTYWFTTCPSDPARLFHATTCPAGGGMGTYDTVVYERNGSGAPGACNDDEAFMCGLRSSITTTIPAGAGLHTLTVDGFGGSVGGYTVSFRENDCTVGFTNCGGTCFENDRFQSDATNCGGCGISCGGGTCRSGTCAPVNDACFGATSLPYLPAGTVSTVTGTITGAAPDPFAPPRPGEPDVWWTFTIPAADGRQFVYLDTFGSAFDTVLFVEAACGTAPFATNDDSSCGPPDSLQSQLAAALDPGTYHVAVTAASGMPTGSITVHMQHVSIASGSMPAGTVPAGTYSIDANTTGAQPFAFACGLGGTASTPTLDFAWVTCPSFGGGAFTATTCSNHLYDTLLEARDGNSSAVTCNDDALGMCGTGSAISTMIPPGAGLHVLSVGGFAGTSGASTITGTRP